MTAYDPYETVADDVRLMLTHALSLGKQVPAQWAESAAESQSRPLSPEAARRLSRTHDALSRAVAPATPRTLRYLERADAMTGWKRHFPLVRRLAALAAIFLVAFVALATRADVGGEAADFENGRGMPLLMNLLFQLSAAGLGATFAALFSVNARLRNYTLDHRDEFANGVRVMLGLVSGLVLAQLAPVSSNGRAFGRPLLALLGGFSVDVVYQTLKRLVELAGSIIEQGPGTGDVVTAERTKSEAREAAVKVGLAQQLVRVRAALPEGDGTRAIDALIAELNPSEAVLPDPVPDPVPDPAPDPAPDPVPDPAPDPEPMPDPVPDEAVPDVAVPEEAPEPAPVPDDPDAAGDPVADGRADVVDPAPARPRRRRPPA